MVASTLVATLFLCWICGVNGKQPRANTDNGVVLGHTLTSHYGSTYLAFEGIPYAKPPIDDKRFKDPEPIHGVWIGEWNATKQGSVCIQFDDFGRKKDEDGEPADFVIGDEDCLFINVYTKEGFLNKDVLVIIHGGGFMFGSGNYDNPAYLMHLNDIVVVTFNYRLGPLGFLSTGDAASPGNYGLKDQSLALEWVQRNIRAFGGDPKKVTLFGVSAGGASVHYHYLSEMSAGLFQKGISLSGVVVNPWAINPTGPEKTRRLASYLGCPTTDSKMMVKCIRRRPARKIVQQMERFKVWLFNPVNLFGPVVDMHSTNPFLKDEPRNLLKQGKVQDLPWITSFTSDEGLLFGRAFMDSDELISELDERWDEIGPTMLAYEESYYNRSRSIASALKEHYLGNRKITHDTLRDVIRMMSERCFTSGIAEAAALQAQANTQPVHIYRYDHVSSFSSSLTSSRNKKTYGASHAEDYMYIIKLRNVDTHVSKTDKEMADLLIKNLHHFVTTGSPSMPVEWLPVSSHPGSKLKLLHIKSVNEIEMREESDVGNSKYLEELFSSDPVTNRDEL